MLASCGSGGSSGFRWATTRPAAVGAASMCDYHRNVAFDGGVLIDAEERETMIRQFAMITFDACRYGPKKRNIAGRIARGTPLLRHACAGRRRDRTSDGRKLCASFGIVSCNCTKLLE